MNRWLKIGGLVTVVTATVVLLLGAAATLAQGPQDKPGFRGDPTFDYSGFERPGFFDAAGESHRRGPGRRGAGGQVTAVGQNSLTVETRNGRSVTVNVSDETRVRIVETQSQGSLTDIEAGDNIHVRGRRNGDGAIEARGILVLPEGDMAGGRVAAVDGGVISVEHPRQDEEATIVANDDTQFRLGRDGEGSLADVAEDKMIMAFGQTQEDGSLLARLVFIHERGPGRCDPQPGRVAGEVTGVEGTSFKIDPFRGDTEITIQTDDSTEYRTRSGEEVAFGDIQTGGLVMVKGEPVEDQENTIRADVVGIKLDSNE